MQSANQEKVTRVNNAAAAAQTDIEATGVAMDNFEGVKFYVAFGTITTGAVTSCKLQQSDDNGVADGWSDLEDSGITVADDDDNQVVVLDCYRPQKRYVRPVVDRGTQNAVVDGIIAVQYGPRVLPTTDDTTTVVGRVLVVSPDEGTA